MDIWVTFSRFCFSRVGTISKKWSRAVFPSLQLLKTLMLFLTNFNRETSVSGLRFGERFIKNSMYFLDVVLFRFSISSGVNFSKLYFSRYLPTVQVT